MKELPIMRGVLRQVTLNYIGGALFVAGFLLLIDGAAGLLVAGLSSGLAKLELFGVTAGWALVLGLSALVFSALSFGLANIQMQLSRIEAKLDATMNGGSRDEPAEVSARLG
jgi:hypothetical protein